MTTAKRRPAGRPSKYDPEFVRDISEQVLIAFYNSEPGQKALAQRLANDPMFATRLRGKAAFTDSAVRAWLDALALVPTTHPDYRRELMFRQWCLRLEPEVTPATLADKPGKEADLRALYLPHCNEEAWRHCQPWLDAIERVRKDKPVKLNIPRMEEEDEDTW